MKHLETFFGYLLLTLSTAQYCSQFKFTRYWIAIEGHLDMDNNGNPVDLSQGYKSVPLNNCQGGLIETVTQALFDKCQMEGTCLLQNGQMVNLGSNNNCFQVLDRGQTPFGTGSSADLKPFTSIASNEIPKGTYLSIPALQGVQIPIATLDGTLTGKTIPHNGCVRVDDEGWSLQGCNVDFFVQTFEQYQKLTSIPDSLEVQILSQPCQLQQYYASDINSLPSVQPSTYSAPSYPSVAATASQVSVSSVASSPSEVSAPSVPRASIAIIDSANVPAQQIQSQVSQTTQNKTGPQVQTASQTGLIVQPQTSNDINCKKNSTKSDSGLKTILDGIVEVIQHIEGTH